ncbi:homoserine kinase [Dactylosporangium sp. CA-139114]|uniref:homoserine kinase n=1 Tax=Dactylosporangium sp. CA-139114 TaxID=3239931 RepID=UPI003D968FAA
MGMAFLSRPVVVLVPATSANLGPGFDALGLALTLYDEVEAQVTAGGVTVEVSGEGEGDLPADETHLVVRAMRRAFAVLGGQPPGLALRCRNRIPQARGLGSSSAAIVAGIVLARALTVGGAERMDDAAALVLADEIEGHPDNVAPCLLGGFTIAWTGDGGAVAVRREPSPDIRPVLFVPEERGLTEVARAALPKTVPHGDAAFNAGRAALLVHALDGDPGALFAATADRLHQDYRAEGMAGTADLVASLRAEGVAAVVSGAGPSVLAFGVGGWTPRPVAGWRVLPLDVDLTGARLEVD